MQPTPVVEVQRSFGGVGVMGPGSAHHSQQQHLQQQQQQQQQSMQHAQDGWKSLADLNSMSGSPLPHLDPSGYGGGPNYTGSDSGSDDIDDTSLDGSDLVLSFATVTAASSSNQVVSGIGDNAAMVNDGK